MRKSKGKIIGYKKERVVLSDVLPYEVPPYFSNRYFYHFLIAHKVCLVNNELRFKKDSSLITEKIICLLFGLENKDKKSHNNYDYYEISDNNTLTIPFNFKIAHKDNDYRELSVIHPINQLQVIDFYDKYKSNIKNATNKSQFSLRKPSKVATLKYFKDKTHSDKRSTNEYLEITESSNKEYTSLKTFFSYESCTNIFKFYESYQYQRAEKRFDKLLKFDISRCFDSIYTHSITWALLNKKIVKENIGKSKNTFGGKFDELMQKMNYNETNGIVIGPEFSRIFAEIILQQVDKAVEKSLYRMNEKSCGEVTFRYKKDYDIYRYVDDYFVFFNDDKIKDEILKLYKIELQKYNLYFNESKTELFVKPIITNITVAKEEIRKLVEHSLIFKLDKDSAGEQLGVKYFYAKDIITNYKRILSETNTSYKDLQNYFLVIIFNKVKKMVSQVAKEQKKLLRITKEVSALTQEQNEKRDELENQKKLVKNYLRNLLDNFNQIIELSFFVYTVLPRVSYAIKLCHILYRIIDFVKNQEKTKQRLSKQNLDDDVLKYIAFDFDTKHSIFKKIYDGILLVFSKNKSNKYSEVETLYILPIVNELGKHYSFSEEILINHFNIKENQEEQFNYFTIISLFNHIESRKEYRNIRKVLNKIVLKKLDNYDSSKAEDVYLFVDILACPYVAEKKEQIEEFRLKVLNRVGFFVITTSKNDKKQILKQINRSVSYFFCNWKGKNYGIELNTKRGHNVY